MRLITYLAPGIPLTFYEVLARHIAAAADEHVTLTSDPRTSGPPPGRPNPLTSGEADIAFMCGPSYLRMRDAVRLVPVAPVFADPRGGGRPVYFAEVVVRADDPATSLPALRGARFAFNDHASLSGRLAVLATLGDEHPPQFAATIAAGSGEAALGLVAAGDADVCSIDSVVWTRLRAERPELAARLRVMEVIGPLPIQPIVAAPSLAPERIARIAGALQELTPDSLAPFGATGMGSVTPEDYDALARLLSVLGDDPCLGPG